MAITIRLPQALAADAGGQHALIIEEAGDETLGDLLAIVSARYPVLGRRICDDTGEIRRFVNVFVGQDESRTLLGLRTPVPADATVIVVGSVAGG